MVLTAEQREPLEICKLGHNLVITGQAGTGKSYLVKVIASAIKDTGKNVQITASTGIAASQFSKGITTHSWSGIRDGRYSNEDVVTRIRAEANIMSNIINTDVLIIDEISMLSAKTFDQIEYVCRQIRNTTRFFGGLQVICVGDFYQLPPVPNNLYQDPGKYSFESEIWTQSMVHKIILETVIRQKDTILIQAINELEKGVPSENTSDLLYRLNRPLTGGDLPTVLYATNFEVDWHNSIAIHRLQGQQYTFKAKDVGSLSALKKISAKKVLTLKVNCPVILIKNLSADLINGSRGEVVHIDEDGPVVKFLSKTVKMSRVCFSVYDTSQQKEIAERYQFPISLAYSLTIHKSQGMTIQNCEIHCNNIRQPGQLGVAIGRATAIEGLRVIDYHPSNCLPHRKEVTNFYAASDSCLSPDLTCCKLVPVEEEFNLEEDIFQDQSVSDDSEFDVNELNEIEAIETSAKTEVCETFSDQSKVTSFLSQLMSTYAVTKAQIEMNESLTKLKTHYMTKAFLNRQYQKVISFVSDTPVDDQKKVLIPKQWTLFYSKYQQYLGSADYTNACNNLFKPLSPNHLVCVHIMTALRKEIIQEYKSQRSDDVLLIKEVEIKPSAHGKIRYVGGMTVAKIKYKNMHLITAAIQSGNVQEVHFMKKLKVEMLEAITVSQGAVIESTKYPHSTLDTFRKQNLSCGLTNISDAAFEFFLELETKRIPLYEQFESFGSQILHHVENTMISDKMFFELFTKLISKSGFRASSIQSENIESGVTDTLDTLQKSVVCIESLFEDIIHTYLSVTDNEFRRNLLSTMGKKKLMEHRKKVLTKHVKRTKGSSSALSIQSIMEDKSVDKQISHMKLKTMILEKQSSLSIFTKQDLLNIGRLYGMELKGKKNIIMEKLAARIKESNSMLSPIRLPVQAINEDLCAQCKVVYSNEDKVPWIGCSTCGRWWHRTCCGLEIDEDWAKYSNTEEKWYCPICLT